MGCGGERYSVHAEEFWGRWVAGCMVREGLREKQAGSLVWEACAVSWCDVMGVVVEVERKTVESFQRKNCRGVGYGFKGEKTMRGLG